MIKPIKVSLWITEKKDIPIMTVQEMRADLKKDRARLDAMIEGSWQDFTRSPDYELITGNLINLCCSPRVAEELESRLRLAYLSGINAGLSASWRVIEEIKS